MFAAAEADGSIVQVHVLKGVDGLAPAGTFHPLPDLSVTAAQSTNPDVVTRVGMVVQLGPDPHPVRQRSAGRTRSSRWT